MMMSYGEEASETAGTWPGPRLGGGARWEGPSSSLRVGTRGQVPALQSGRGRAGAVRGLLHSVARPSPPSSLGGVTKLGLTKFEAKIGQGNEPSIRMFQKLHFEQVRMLLVEGQGLRQVVGPGGAGACGCNPPPPPLRTQVAVSSVFQEVTLRLTVNEHERQWLLEQTSHVEERCYGDGSPQSQ